MTDTGAPPTDAFEAAIAALTNSQIGRLARSDGRGGSTTCRAIGEALAAARRQNEVERIMADQQLVYWWETKHSCPCGARPESPDTHGHVPGCPTAVAIARLGGRDD